MAMRRKPKTKRPPVPRLKWPRDFIQTKAAAPSAELAPPTKPDTASSTDARRRPT